MIEIGINQVYKNFGFKNVLNGLSFEVIAGERVALVGRNGTGKSTVLKMIAGEQMPDRGTVSLRRGATVGYLEQIPMLVDSHLTVWNVLIKSFDRVYEAEQRLRDLEGEMAATEDPDALDVLMKRYASAQNLFETLGGYEMEENLSRLVAGFGLEELLSRPFNILSGGQKTIVKLACTILSRPDILLLDEPTNHLDMKTLAWFEEMLLKYAGTIVIVSHDRYFLDKVATKTVIFSKGRCETFGGNYTFSLEEQQRQLLVEFEHYKTQQKKIAAMRAAIKRYREWGLKNDEFYRKAKELEHRIERMEMIEKPELEKAKVPIRFAGARTGKEVLRLDGFSFAYGDLRLFDGADLLVREREKVCLLGDNGTGKTTLIRAILKEERGYLGELTVSPGAKVGYIPQEIRFEDDQDTVVSAFRREYTSTEGEARNLLARFFFFGDGVFKRVSMLSGGEKVLLKLAVLVMRQVNFLILDEPTNHIDIETREMLEEALNDYTGTLLFISHDRYFIRKVASRVVAIEGQKIVEVHGGVR